MGALPAPLWGCSTPAQAHKELQQGLGKAIHSLDHSSWKLPAGPTVKGAGDLSQGAVWGLVPKWSHQSRGDESVSSQSPQHSSFGLRVGINTE